jgi:dihydroorotate dehydrogenase
MSLDAYRRAIRPLLCRIDPETAHALARPVLGSATLSRALAGAPLADPRLRVTLAGMPLTAPIGLAPGFDKHGEMLGGLGELGFGYLVLGTVMPDPRDGNPRPRIVRRPAERAMVNAMGLPSHGVEAIARRLERRRSRVPLIASIGGLDEEGYLRVLTRIQPLVAAVVVNLRCNNNRDEHPDFLEPDTFERLYRRLVDAARVPLHLKVTEWNDEAERTARLEIAARAQRLGVASLVTSSVLRADEPGLSVGRGNLTGAPLVERTIAGVRELRDATGGRLPIRARGGISNGRDAFRALAAGATTVELFTAFLYRGWEIPNLIARELLLLMDREGIGHVAEITAWGGSAPSPVDPETAAAALVG